MAIGRSTDSVEYSVPSIVFSVCTASEISIWTYTVSYLLTHVPSLHYLVVVPDLDVSLFRSITPKTVTVMPESVVVGDLRTRLEEKLAKQSQARVGWYLQQFIKLSILYETKIEDKIVIWDADTVPLRPINFFRDTGAVEFFFGSECHTPYFALNKRILGYGKVAPFSFIAQCFPCKGVWAKSFFDYFERTFADSYESVLLEMIDFGETSGFSEYELFGSFIFSNFSDQVLFKQDQWMRCGSGIIGSPNNIDRLPYKSLIEPFAHISFERWEEPFSVLSSQDVSFQNAILHIEASNLPSFDDYLDEIFSLNLVRSVVQIGANDGVQNDPLRKYFTIRGPYDITLVEPIPYYVEKLRNLYEGRSDVSIVEAAAGSIKGAKPLYFLPPELACEMNGEGPRNDWAHGQGSFDRNIIEFWIRENSFRGDIYVSRIDEFIRSITSIDVQLILTESALPKIRSGLLLLIDVQGHEFEVLDGVDWTNPPQWVVVEDDLGKSLAFLNYFSKKGFRWVAGSIDKIFARC